MILSFLIILITSIYMLFQKSQNSNIEDLERNYAEKIWFSFVIGLSIIIFSLFLYFKIYYFQIFDILSIITTSLAWDFSSRNGQEVNREIFTILTLIQAYLTAQSIGSWTSFPPTFSSFKLQSFAQ